MLSVLLLLDRNALKGADLSGCNLQSVDFSDCALGGSNFETAYLGGCSFSSTLFDARYEGADFSDAKLKLSNSSFSDLTKDFLLIVLGQTVSS